MENPTEQPLKTLKEQVTEYIDLRTAYLRLSAIENMAKVVAWFSSAFILTILVMLFLLSLVIACSFFFGQWLHSYGLGFLISAGLYLIFLILFLLGLRKKSEKAIMNKIIKLTELNEQE